MEGDGRREEWAFYLKRKGDFKDALKAYAAEYAKSLQQKARFIAGECFREMFDTALLLCVQKERFFESRAELVDAIRSEIAEALRSAEAPDGAFDRFFEECRKGLFPRGRGKARYSVDGRLLVINERIKLVVSE